MSWKYIVLSCVISVVVAQGDNLGLDTSNFGLDPSITLPPQLQGKFNESDIENVKSKYLEQFKKKCEKNGHPEAYENAQTAVQNLMSCTQSLVDMNVLQQEIEDAKPHGKVDEVFKKYCAKTPEFKNCFRNMTDTVKPCFAPSEQKNFKTVYNVTDQLSEFICYKDGDRIALFIAEGGKECFQDKQEQIQNCFNQTFDSQTQSQLQNITVDNLENIFDLEFKEKQCDQMTQLQKCIVAALESCEKPTSANIVDSLFNFIRKATPCKKFAQAKAGVDTKTKSGNTGEKNSHSSASVLAVTTGTLFMALIAAILV